MKHFILFMCILILVSCDFTIAVAQCGTVKLGGFHFVYDINTGDKDHYFRSAEFNPTWKAIRFIADNTGQATCADIYLFGLTGNRTNDDVWVVIYEDGVYDASVSAYTVGNLKVWGHISNYNWNNIGVGQYHPVLLDHIETTRNIVSGQAYWIVAQSSITSPSPNYVGPYLSRGTIFTSGCATDKRGAAHYPPGSISKPPPGSEFNDQHIVYGDNCYEWSVWGGGVTTTTTIDPNATTTTSTASATFTISGKITGAISASVPVGLSGASSEMTATDSNGDYQFPNLISGYYVITPSLESYTFDPANREIPLLISDTSDINFVSSVVPLCATEVIYGENSEEIELLRYIRDNVLNQNLEGQEIIRLYYEWSPVIVREMEEDEEFKEDVKEMIDGVLELIGGSGE